MGVRLPLASINSVNALMSPHIGDPIWDFKGDLTGHFPRYSVRVANFPNQQRYAMARKVKVAKPPKAPKATKSAAKKPSRPRKAAAAPEAPPPVSTAGGVAVIGKTAFLRLIKETNEIKGTMDEANIRLKGRIDNAVAANNVHPEALKLARKYAKREPVRGSDFLRHLKVYFDYLGLADDTVDLFANQAADEAGEAIEAADEPLTEDEQRVLDMPGDPSADANVHQLGRPTGHIRKGRVVDIAETEDPLTDLERQLRGGDAA